mmetsp:Transcript_564/g.966  ORF Transcript_564/g.966 Transcript_564/m.966 type:complete len:244 (-) Transcript_564:726-1457(-)|eukprot:CAMPEP_0203776612 /NCGR_PEP_ID=MMETSP0099_2-20121227/6848_1 /ASSEMBLY_ACC=CAM_ASM_000209 /TAXON_ID=96639 /ORGANISM=" , Strain NY0313808BC1" /LENGTH=243 /DNA_ID=CAMNT_0050675649 /DNA_START=700 /DNA_END=1431 /DNA_ORIENTATION=+
MGRNWSIWDGALVALGSAVVGLNLYLLLADRRDRCRDVEGEIAAWAKRKNHATSADKVAMKSGGWHLPTDGVLCMDRDFAHDGCVLLDEMKKSTQTKLRLQVLKHLVECDPVDTPHIEPGFLCDYGYNIRLGKNVYMNFNCILLDSAPIHIGDNTLFGPGCMLMTPNHPLDPNLRLSQQEQALPIKIGSNCWVGANVVVIGGVEIGDNVVIAAGAVVTKDIPSNVLVAGVPARVKKKLNPGWL